MKEPRTRNGISYSEAAKMAGAVNSAKKQFRVVEYQLSPSLCKLCKNPIPYEKRKNVFCSHSCAAVFNNSGTVRNITNGKWSKKPCAYCGKTTSNIKCCSNNCFSFYVKQKRRERIKRHDALIDCKKDKWYLIEKRSHTCEQCSTSIWNGEDIPLDAHHKDGDSDNNQLDNLLLICPNCHRQTENHGSKNKTQSKRKQYRKDRYDKGLSY